MTSSGAIGDSNRSDMQKFSAVDLATIAKPLIEVVKCSNADELIVNACDGIWDCL